MTSDTDKFFAVLIYILGSLRENLGIIACAALVLVLAPLLAAGLLLRQRGKGASIRSLRHLVAECQAMERHLRNR